MHDASSSHQSPPPSELISDALDGDFGVLRQFMSEALQFDRETHACMAVLTTRLEFLTDQVDHLMNVVDQDDSVPSLVIQFSRRQESVAALGRDVDTLTVRVSTIRKDPEGFKGKWAAIGTAITAGSGLVLGVLNYWR